MMANVSEYATAAKSGDSIVVDVEDYDVLQRAKLINAELGKSGDEELVKTATEIATKSVVEELKKTGAYNASVKSNVVINTEYPVQI